MVQLAYIKTHPELTALPTSHRTIMAQIKRHEYELSVLKKIQDDLISCVQRMLMNQTMIILARQNCGGRVYLRWRWRLGTRGFLNLFEHLHQFDTNDVEVLLEFEDKRQRINVLYSIEYHSYQRMLEYKKHQGVLRKIRSQSGVLAPTQTRLTSNSKDEELFFNQPT